MWRKLSTQIFSSGVTVTRRYLEHSGGGISKHVCFPKGSKMYNLGIGSTSLYTYKGKPITMNIFTAKGANGRAAGSQLCIGNRYEDAVKFLRNYIKKGENNIKSFLA